MKQSIVPVALGGVALLLGSLACDRSAVDQAPIEVMRRAAPLVVPLDAAAFAGPVDGGAAARPVADRIGRVAGPCVLGGELTIETVAGPRTVAFINPACRPTGVGGEPALLLRPPALPTAPAM